MTINPVKTTIKPCLVQLFRSNRPGRLQPESLKQTIDFPGCHLNPCLRHDFLIIRWADLDSDVSSLLRRG
jgi:hypothetical protein